eukprot:GFUD01064867.1.p1 GENE.GFUD01064867.1~~GFUD01064867.1.p1  ORF type:complete len:306 (-),score=36.23 GFUD01064867.1:598-1515(-)
MAPTDHAHRTVRYLSGQYGENAVLTVGQASRKRQEKSRSTKNLAEKTVDNWNKLTTVLKRYSLKHLLSSQFSFSFLEACPPCGDYWKPWTGWTSCTNGEKTQTRSKSLDLNKQTSEFTGMDCSHVEDRIENRDCPDSHLKWISASTAKSLRNPENYANFVMPMNRYKYPENKYQMFCRAEIDGCNYPGSLLVRTDGRWVCSIITQGKIYFDYGGHHNLYQVLWNPNGPANIAWLPWASGSDSTSFPDKSVKSDAACGLTLGRYNDYNEAAMVTSDGNVYYNDGGSYDNDWEWDNNEYDILIEKGV